MSLRKKELFLNIRNKVPMATKPRPRGGGGEALVAGPLTTKKRTFFAASLTWQNK